MVISGNHCCKELAGCEFYGINLLKIHASSLSALNFAMRAGSYQKKSGLGHLVANGPNYQQK